MSHIEYNENGHARAFVGKEAVDVFAMAALAAGLRLYAKTGIRPNRAWTPRAMMTAAAHHLGIKLKPHDYERAAELLSAKVQSEKARLAKEEK